MSGLNATIGGRGEYIPDDQIDTGDRNQITKGKAKRLLLLAIL